MTRAVRGGPRTGVAIREAAAKLFYEHGYEATSLRAVAGEVGIQVGSLYNHIRSKEELLTDIMVSVMDELLDEVRAAVDAAGPTALDRFKAAVACHIRFHAEHAREVFIGNGELRALSGDDLNEVVSRRTAYEQLLQSLVVAVGKETDARILDPKLQTYSVLAQGAHVSSWYKPRGPKSLDKVVQTYITMFLRQLGLDDDA